MTQLQNAAFLRALPRQPTAYTALRMMRLAGRYLPEYKQIRRRAGDFLDVCAPLIGFSGSLTTMNLERDIA